MSKTIAVFGVGPGTGPSVARRFGREGFQVALVARNQTRLDAFTGELAADGIKAAGLAGDLADRDALPGMIEAITARFGPIDVLEYAPSGLDLLNAATEAGRGEGKTRFQRRVTGMRVPERSRPPAWQRRQGVAQECRSWSATNNKEIRMPKIVITHSVADVDTWLKRKSERAAAIGVMGGTNVVDHVAEDGSKTIAVTFDVDDVGIVTATYASPPAELAEVMERHGVLPPVTVYVER